MDGIFLLGNHQLQGANAEIVSVLSASSLWNDLLPAGGWENIARAIDTRSPPNERAPIAQELTRAVKRCHPLAKWVPRYDMLPENEFRQEFFAAYRDHSVHTLATWLLGLYLYETVPALRESLDTALRARSATSHDALSLFKCWWTFTAMWHDTAYPFEIEKLTSDAEIRSDGLSRLSSALSADAFRVGLEDAGIALTAGMLRQLHQAGRYAPFQIESVVQLLSGSDPNRVVDLMWKRLGLNVPADSRAELLLDDLTMKSPLGRPPYHDHGLFGALLLTESLTHTMSFLDDLTIALSQPRFASLTSNVGAAARNKLDESYLEFLQMSPVVAMAVEAIAYHSFDFGTLDLNSIHVHFGSGWSRPLADLRREPHLVFLAVADTLQDWDRHGFRPTDSRTARRSDEVLVQGTTDGIRLAHDGDHSPAGSIVNQLNAWVSGIGSLFADGAQFTRSKDIQLQRSAPTAQAVEDSASRMERLRNTLSTATKDARQALLLGGEDAVMRAAAVIEPVLMELSNSRGRLTTGDQRTLDEFRKRELREVERHAAVAIRPDSRLPIGRVVAKIGGGGFGEVYRVHDDRHGRSLAFKAFHGGDLDDEDKRFYFERGVRAMTDLRYDVGVVEVDRLLFVPFGLSMQFIEGDNLEVGVRGVGDAHERLEVLQLVAETLAAAHHKGIIHRDVKPANVLLDATRDGTPVLTDFDLAHMTGKTTIARAHWVSQLYGAPEQFNRRLEEWSRKPGVDVYGFGALSYFVMTLREPPPLGYYTEEHWGILQGSLDGHLPATVVARFGELVKATTVADPQQRLAAIEPGDQMEHIVRELAMCRASSATAEGGAMERSAWLAEVAFAINGRADLTATIVISKSRGTSWNLDLSRDAGKLIATCRLNREPRFEGVNYQGFTRKSSRQVDRVLDSLGRTGKASRAQRHGELRGAGSEMRVEIGAVQLTRSFGRQVGDLLAAVSRAVE